MCVRYTALLYLLSAAPHEAHFPSGLELKFDSTTEKNYHSSTGQISVQFLVPCGFGFFFPNCGQFERENWALNHAVRLYVTNSWGGPGLLLDARCERQRQRQRQRQRLLANFCTMAYGCVQRGETLKPVGH